MRTAHNDSPLRNQLGFAGTVVPLTLAASSVVLIGVAFWSGQHALAAVSAWLALKSLLFVDLRSRILSRQPGANVRADDAQRFLGSAVTLWLLLTAAFGLGFHSSDQLISVGQTLTAIAALTVVTLLSGILLEYFQQDTTRVLSEQKKMAAWCRASLWMCAAALVSTLLIATGVVESQKTVVRGLLLFAILPVLEWLIRTLVRNGGIASLVSDVRYVDFLFSRRNPVLSAFTRLERGFGIDVRSTWALTFARRAFVPLAFGLLIVAWLSTSVVTVGTLQAGILERFGRPVSAAPLGPGIHFKAPWPIDRVHRIDTTRVQSMTLGFSGPKAGASLLWTRQHAAEEYSLLLGDGRDLVTINAVLTYTVDDPRVWHFGTQNPRATLRVAAEQALLNSTANRSLNAVLSENTASLVRQIEEDIRLRIEDYGIGARVVSLSLQGLHPPLRVAEDYQAVVSAQHEQEVSILESRSYEVETLQRAREHALALVTQAEATAAGRIGTARGEAEAFRALEAAHAAAPGATQQRLRLTSIEGVLDGRSFLVVDDRIERDGGVLWFEN